MGMVLAIMSRSLGATPAEWEHFADICDGAAALLPAVADPKAAIRSGSKLKPDQLGKIPSRYDGDGKAVGFGAWTAYTSTPSDLHRWSEAGGYNISVQCRSDGLQAIDIDIADSAEAARVVSFIEDQLLQRLPLRWRENSGKVLIPIRVAKPVRKRVIRTRHGNIELLGEGQQFIAAGQHPSGVRYRWMMSDGAERLPVDADIPTLTLEQFEDLVAALQSHFGVAPLIEGKASTPPRQEVMARVHTNDPVAKFLLEQGWVFDSKPDLALIIRCPFEKGHSTGQAGDTSSLYYPAHTNGYEQGHFKCLHASCAHRSDHDFLQECGYRDPILDAFEDLTLSKGEISDGASPREPQRLLPRKPRTGKIIASLESLRVGLGASKLTGAKVRYDTFTDQQQIAWDAEPWRPMTDGDAVELRRRLATVGGFEEIGRELMRDALRAHQRTCAVDTAHEWLMGLRWDGVPRIARFAVDYLRADDTELNREIGRYIWTALAGRVVEPGCEAAMVPVLIGAQGAGKTRGIKAIAPDQELGAETYVELRFDMDDDKWARLIRGKLVGEIGELRGLASREVEEIKARISRTSEEWVPKFAEFSTRYPRRCLLFGTTNNADFLADVTGERRWLPIEVGRVNVEAIARDRAQLWAEGAAQFRRDGIAFRKAEELARDIHWRHKIDDAWAGPLIQWAEGEDGLDGVKRNPGGSMGFAIRDALVMAIGMRLQDITSAQERRAAKIFQAYGYKPVRRKVRGAKVTLWTRDDRGQDGRDGATINAAPIC